MLSQFYLDPVIMSKENSRKPTFENKRSSHHGGDSNADFSRKGGGLSIEHIVSGNGLSKSNIDFLKNLSENILSVKDTESEFSYKRTDSYEKRNNITNNNTSSSSGVYDDCSSISSFEFVRPDDNRYSSRRKKTAPAIRNAIANHNDSYEINSKQLSTINKKICDDTSSRESSIEKQEKHKKKSFNNNTNSIDTNNNHVKKNKTVKETNIDEVGPLKNEGPCLSPRLLEPSTKIHTGSRKHDYNDRQRYEKFKRYHDNPESNERHNVDSSDDSHDVISPNSSDGGDSLSLDKQRGGNSPSRSKGRFADARIDKRAQRKIEESTSERIGDSRERLAQNKNGNSYDKYDKRSQSRNLESPLRRSDDSLDKLAQKKNDNSYDKYEKRSQSRNLESPLRRNDDSLDRITPHRSDSYEKYPCRGSRALTPTSSLELNHNNRGGRDTPSSSSDSNERPPQPPTYSYHRRNKNRSSYCNDTESENNKNTNRNSYCNDNNRNQNNNNENENKRNSYYNDNETGNIKELHSRVRSSSRNQVKSESVVDRNHRRESSVEAELRSKNDALDTDCFHDNVTDELEPIYENLCFDDEQERLDSLKLNAYTEVQVEGELDKDDQIDGDMKKHLEPRTRLRNDSFINGRNNNNRHIVAAKKQRPTQPAHVTQHREQHEPDYACFTIESSSSACSSTDSSDLETLDEWKRLDSILAHIDPSVLVEYLQGRVKERDQTTLQNLSTLLPKTKFTGHTSHCVRCHSDYDPEHGDMNCVLFHDVKDVDMISQDDSCALFQCERCFTAFRLYGEFKYTQENARKCGPCFRGAHTSLAEEVEYKPEGGAQTCTEKGCSVYYV